jgi:hypothetical protein
MPQPVRGDAQRPLRDAELIHHVTKWSMFCFRLPDGDLAAMCMSIEGGTHIPAFLVHDSPREADLGLSHYHRLFQLARGLEQFGDQPLFQYIVTTTTRPPDELMQQPWCERR